MNTSTESNLSKTPKSEDGYQVGQSITDKVGFYGKTPISQPTHADQAAATAITDGSTGTASATDGIAPLTGTYNSTLLINAIATLAEGVNGAVTLANRLRTELVNLGLVKGS